jgi:hypothetical protein
MFKMRLTMVAFLGVLGLTGVAASSASAGWFIEGEELASGSKAALASTAKVDTAPVLTILPGSPSKVKVECGGSLLRTSEPNIIGTETLKAKSITFEGCKVTEPTTGCALEGQPTTITTNPLVSTPTEGASFPESRLTLKPQTKKTLAELAFSESSTCLGGGGQKPVVGSLTVKAPTLQEELATQPIEALGSTENNSLEIAGDKTILEKGKTLLALATGQGWVWHKPNAPVIRVIRISGEGSGTKECRFKTTGAKCVVRAEIVSNPSKNSLEVTVDEIVGAKFTFVVGGAGLGMEKECNKGLNIGSAINKGCADEIEYTGPANPTKNQFTAQYIVTVREIIEGGQPQTATSTAMLAAS